MNTISEMRAPRQSRPRYRRLTVSGALVRVDDDWIPAAAAVTKANSHRMRDPANFTVELFDDGCWLATLDNPTACFMVARVEGEPAVALVRSNTGSEYEVNVQRGTCPCRHHERFPDEFCKHLAAAVAVARWNVRQRAARREAEAKIAQADAQRADFDARAGRRDRRAA